MSSRTGSDEWMLGLGGSNHDFSAALLHGNDIRVGIEVERVTRVKYGVPEWFADPVARCVDYCLDAEGIARTELAGVVSSDLLPYQTLERWRIARYPHHLCHAASAVMLLPPETHACVLVYDGSGSVHPVASERDGDLGDLECETFSWFDFNDGRLERIGATTGRQAIEWLGLLDGNTNSIGNLYELISSMIGFGRREVGKTMGLAGWGVPRYLWHITSRTPPLSPSVARRIVLSSCTWVGRTKNTSSPQPSISLTSELTFAGPGSSHHGRRQTSCVAS